ncbi:hypothetical protein [Corynebacterium ammoniagenes]|uniref:hypothetical protein n=1 Tax=Corynebacterium ammoniagenes TaxID=1697 RepID=UPI001F29270B|nr:hypothetical protein [Corynebacterium ammoniagenes]
MPSPELAGVLAPMFWYRCSGELVLKYSGLLVLGFSPAGSLFRRWSCFPGSALLVGGVVGTGQSLAQVVVAEVDAFAGDGAGA